MVKDNAEPLRSLIANIDKFSGALARNSDRVDGILAGIERMTGGTAKTAPRVFDLPAARAFPPIPKLPKGQLLIAEPTTLNAFESEKIVVDKDGESVNLEGGQWPDMLTRVVQARLAQSFENAHYLGALGRAPDNFRADHQLLIEIKSFKIAEKPSRKAEVEIVARLLGSDGQILGARTFRAEEPITALDPQTAAAALGNNFQKVAAEIVVWVCAEI